MNANHHHHRRSRNRNNNLDSGGADESNNITRGNNPQPQVPSFRGSKQTNTKFKLITR